MSWVKAATHALFDIPQRIGRVHAEAQQKHVCASVSQRPLPIVLFLMVRVDHAECRAADTAGIDHLVATDRRGAKLLNIHHSATKRSVKSEFGHGGVTDHWEGARGGVHQERSLSMSHAAHPRQTSRGLEDIRTGANLSASHIAHGYHLPRSRAPIRSIVLRHSLFLESEAGGHRDGVREVGLSKYQGWGRGGCW